MHARASCYWFLLLKNSYQLSKSVPPKLISGLQPRMVTLYAASPEPGCHRENKDSGPDQSETISVSMSFTTEDADDVDDYNSAAPTNDLDEEDSRHRKHTHVSSSERHQRRHNSRSRLCPRCR